jgi:diadenosine tetraphosphatase ApaH/serine/threonine PP2A family protein phosphatase
VSVLLFFNELCCSAAPQKERVDYAMAQFVRLLNHIVQWRRDAALVSGAKLKDLELAPGYYLAEWAGQPRHIDLWRGIRRVQNRAPFSDVLPVGASEGVDYFWEGRTAKALGAAHLLDEILVSLLVDPAWDAPWIQADRTLLSEDVGGETVILEDTVQVRHAATLAHSAVHEEWIKHAGLPDLSHGSEIWEARVDLFPHLSFLPHIKEQMGMLNRDWVVPLARELRRINDAIEGWDPRLARQPQWRSRITPEGETRKRLCKFEDFDGVERIFDLHGRFTPGHGRVYFRLVPEARKATVAHVGLKLGI